MQARDGTTRYGLAEGNGITYFSLDVMGDILQTRYRI